MDLRHKGNLSIHLSIHPFIYLSFFFSLGVEPVDHDVMKQPPRKATDRMINFNLLIRILSSAFIIVTGTFWIFWKEVHY